MNLTRYRQKRKFDRTPEPEGKEKSLQGPLRFVVQKHQASRLHYDLRLELDGTLKSWAVPKGPSLNPEDKRLAMMVEDHPLEYRTFEGVIPKGNYGAGTVMVWDEGTYHARETTDREESQKSLREGLRKGHLTVVLNGRKLKGEFALVRLRKAEENAWLLLKKRDEFAADRDVIQSDRSAVTSRTLEEIAERGAKGGEVWTKHNANALELTGAPKSKILRDVKPMLSTLVEKPFDRQGWVFEIKWDGYRAIAEVESGKVRLYSRNQLSLADRFVPVVQSLQNLRHEAVLDGEVVIVDDAGKPHFQLLQNYQRSGKGRLVYYVFDLLYLNGHDLRSLPLKRRKELLKQILGNLPHIEVSDHIEDQGIPLFEFAQQKNLEGMIAKDGGSPYQQGRRSQYWLKVKTQLRQEAVIGGYTEPRGGRKHFGALVLGVYEAHDLIYIGHTGGGFDGKSLAAIRALLQPLVQTVSPFKKRPKTNAPVQWVQPKLVCEVRFHGWTAEGQMRQPTFMGMRHDKLARSVRRERAVPVQQLLNQEPEGLKKGALDNRSGEDNEKVQPAVQKQAISIGGHRLSLTNLNKVYWRSENYTKRDLINYYREIAPFILPYLKDRPQSLHRHPDGIEGESFYQKNVDLRPPWIETAKIRSESGDKDINYLLCQDEATLLYLANLGCIEINSWSSRVATLDRPDYLVIDLDPENVAFERVVETAIAVRKTLEKADAESLCKSSGKTGLHIYLPLGARYDYDQVKQFAEIIAHVVHEKIPEFTSLLRSPANRQQKVYVDFLQNRRGQTLAAPYSLRPTALATVATPLKWQEVRRGLDPSKFTIRTMAKRLDKVGDLWRPVLGPGIDLIKCLERLEGRVKNR